MRGQKSYRCAGCLAALLLVDDQREVPQVAGLDRVVLQIQEPRVDLLHFDLSPRFPSAFGVLGLGSSSSFFLVSISSSIDCLKILRFLSFSSIILFCSIICCSLFC